MSAFLQTMQMPPFPEKPELGGRATLYFFSRHAGMLEVWMEAGQLINRKAADILLRLLKLNQAGDDGPLLCACMDEHTGKPICARKSAWPNAPAAR